MRRKKDTKYRKLKENGKETDDEGEETPKKEQNKEVKPPPPSQSLPSHHHSRKSFLSCNRNARSRNSVFEHPKNRWTVCVRRVTLAAAKLN